MDRIPSRLLLILLLSAPLAWGQPQYTITELGAFRPEAIAGDWIVGTLDEAPVRYHIPTGAFQPLEDLGYGGLAFAVVPSGRAAGGVRYPDTPGGPLQIVAAVWEVDGAVTVLTPPGSYATAMDGQGILAGQVARCAGRWTPGHPVESLCAPGSWPSYGVGLDAQHRVYGTLETPDGAWHAAAWDVEGRVVDLGTLGGTRASLEGATADGAFVGWSEVASGHLRALGGTLEAGLVELPMPAPEDGPIQTVQSYAYGLNAKGARVGGGERAGPSGYAGAHALLWAPEGPVYDLNALLGMPTSVSWGIGINDEGHIIGMNLEGSRGYSFLLTPQPSRRERLIAALCERRAHLRVCQDGSGAGTN